MSKRFHSFYSHALGRDMGMNIHGHAGKPCVVFPSQDGSYDNFEGFGMLEPCTPYLRDGKLRLYCVDSIDRETWSNKGGNPRHRMERHEAWFRYLTDELTPFIHQDTGWQGRLMTTGCSMGATHAANLLFRRPDLYDTVIGLSGAYDAAWLMDGYTDDLVHLNSPVSSVSERAMPESPGGNASSLPKPRSIASCALHGPIPGSRRMKSWHSSSPPTQNGGALKQESGSSFDSRFRFAFIVSFFRLVRPSGFHD